MTPIKSLFAIAALAGASALAVNMGTASAETAGARAEMHPRKGVSLDVGAKRVVSYFSGEKGACDLVVWLSDGFAEDAPATKTAQLVSVSVEPGKSARIDTAEGKTMLFGCKTGAAGMTLQTVDQLASVRN